VAHIFKKPGSSGRKKFGDIFDQFLSLFEQKSKKKRTS
jgi:hypothetical protein